MRDGGLVAPRNLSFDPRSADRMCVVCDPVFRSYTLVEHPFPIARAAHHGGRDQPSVVWTAAVP
jgi:hypothetical protein